MNKRRRNERGNTIRSGAVLDTVGQHKPQVGVDHKATRQPTLNPKITPYDTGKVKIGIYYEPKYNYYNHDQDWVQKAILGIETAITTDVVVFCAMYSLVLYIVMGLLTRSWYD